MKPGRLDRAVILGVGAVVAILLLVIMGFERIAEMEARTGTREAESVRIMGLADELVRLERANTALAEALRGGEPVMRTVERIAAAEGLAVAATSTAGAANVGIWRETFTSVRFAGAALTPLKRALSSIESSRAAVVLRELTLRRSIDRAKRLDVEIVIGSLDIETESDR
jgi:hypothetical protein